MKMKTITFVNSPKGLKAQFIETNIPIPGPYEVLVKIKAFSINRLDILQKMGRYPIPVNTTGILGLDGSGIVQSIGKKVSLFRPRERVFGLFPGGTYGEYALIHQNLLWKMDKKLDFINAAAIPEAFTTAYQALFKIGHLKKGHNVLIHAGASGVGSAAIALANNFGANCYATCGLDQKVSFCNQLGSQLTINYRKDSFAHVFDEKNISMNLILDFVGGENFNTNISLLKKNGKIILISYLGGSKVSEFDLRPLLQNWLEIHGTTLRSRPLSYRSALAKEMKNKIIPLFNKKIISPTIFKTFNWKEIEAAHQLMEENKAMGKIVLSITD